MTPAMFISTYSRWDWGVNSSAAEEIESNARRGKCAMDRAWPVGQWFPSQAQYCLLILSASKQIQVVWVIDKPPVTRMTLLLRSKPGM